ncbi:MAG: FtsQ-type POTRA domain-containing protein [Thermodesulfobacteriota bacterium]
MSRRSRLVPQKPVRKKTVLGSSRPRNSYRRRLKLEGGKFWRSLIWGVLGVSCLASLCLGLVLLYYQLLTSDLFSIKDIRNIKIEGTQRLDPADILQMANLGPEANLLALRPGRVEQALLTHPWIAHAEVTRKWPNRLYLRLQEREPAALVQLGELYYADRQGKLLKPLAPGDPHDYPIITGLTPELFEARAGSPPLILTQVFQLLDLLKNTPPPLNLENISEVHVDTERGFTLYANGLRGRVEIGLSDFSERLDKFQRVWPILAQKGYLRRVGRINLASNQRVLLSLEDGNLNP